MTPKAPYPYGSAYIQLRGQSVVYRPERLYRTTGDWHALIVLFSDRAESADDDETASLLIRIIDVIVNQLEDGDGALETIESALLICDDRRLFEHATVISRSLTLRFNRSRKTHVGAALLESGLEDGVLRLVSSHLAQAGAVESDSQEQIGALRAAASELLSRAR